MLKGSILTMWQKLRGTLTKANAVKVPCSDAVAKANRLCSDTLAKAKWYIVKGTRVLYSDAVAVLARQVLCCMFFRPWSCSVYLYVLQTRGLPARRCAVCLTCWTTACGGTGCRDGSAWPPP